MKYQTLDSKQRANYWALMNLIDLFHQYLGEDHPQANNFCTEPSCGSKDIVNPPSASLN